MNQTPTSNAVAHKTERERVIIFDGVCNLCNASINFIIARDPNARFSFTTVQSDYGRTVLAQLGIDHSDPSTFVLIKQGQVFLMSNAALEIAKDLSGLWKLLSVFKWVPRIIRDQVYLLIARNRYRLMGKRAQCMVPTQDIKARFID